MPDFSTLGWVIGEAMARRSRNVEDMAKRIGTEPATVRSWLSGDEVPEPVFVARMRSALFWSGAVDAEDWSRFLSIWDQARKTPRAIASHVP
jgi:hypothetical protein